MGRSPEYLGYGDQQGYEALRQLIVERMGEIGIQADASRILVTSGSSQAIDLACRVFLEEGDAVLVEDPTFLGATELFRAYGARIVGIETDDSGMRMDSLEAALGPNHAQSSSTRFPRSKTRPAPRCRSIVASDWLTSPGSGTLPFSKTTHTWSCATPGRRFQHWSRWTRT